MSWPKTALLSLSEKAGASDFARALVARGTRILASGGTARHLEAAGVAATPVERTTGFDELLGGRVKTLHPHVHAPILARRHVAEDLAALAERDLEPIDLVAVSLYPFEARAGTLDEAGMVDEIDIGGVAMLRAAAKNFADVIVVHDCGQYAEVLAVLESGGPTLDQRRRWALATFARTARYDAAIAAELERRAGAVADLPGTLALFFDRVRALRHGENPHQAGALYVRAGESARLEAWKEGKDLSFNNLLDLEAAVSLVWRFEPPACVIVKHAQPCGVAVAETPELAYQAAFSCDALSAFGGVIAFNRPLDGEAAHAVARQFVECVAAPSFTEEALARFASKKNLRVLRLAAEDVARRDAVELRGVGRWALGQRESPVVAPEWRSVTRRAPTGEESAALRFAWEVVTAARSNAIAMARGTALVGIGSGQTSRVDAVDVAILKARRAGHDLAGTALASDGFFPFADNVEHAAAAGVTAMVQPGGSMRDAEVIEACDRLGLTMAFTDRRTFRHS